METHTGLRRALYGDTHWVEEVEVICFVFLWFSCFIVFCKIFFFPFEHL